MIWSLEGAHVPSSRWKPKVYFAIRLLMDGNGERVYTLTTGAVLMVRLSSRTEPRRDIIHGKLAEFPTTCCASPAARPSGYQKASKPGFQATSLLTPLH